MSECKCDYTNGPKDIACSCCGANTDEPCRHGSIAFDRALAVELQRELSPMMYEFHDNACYGAPYYSCHFCARFCYPSKPGAVKLNEIDHMPDCLGIRLLRELDEKLR